MTMFAMKTQNRNWEMGRKVRLRCLDVCNIGMSINTRIEASRAKTPPSLLGIERRMAYAKRKYHSGLMWGGVVSGLAGLKLSGSPSRSGVKRAIDVSMMSRMAKPRRSL
ncbi:hypothetical protein LDENG_00218990 [Lucifuga dentata]|nr:hypothetical protein LDENG_00218990 [Lucifuga dentata]